MKARSDGESSGSPFGAGGPHDLRRSFDERAPARLGFAQRLQAPEVRAAPIGIDAIQRARGEPDHDAEDHDVRRREQREADLGLIPAGFLPLQAQPPDDHRQQDGERQHAAGHEAAVMLAEELARDAAIRPRQHETHAERAQRRLPYGVATEA